MKISADFIYAPHIWLDQHLLEIDEAGTIIQLRERRPDEQTIHYHGLLCPGWVNAHCHLELSALKGHIPTGTGMTGFIGEIFLKRDAFTDKEKRIAVEKAMEKLLAEGTVAVGDICNSTISIQPKKDMPELFTHSFIELLGLDPLQVDAIIENGRELSDAFATLSRSITPHAPYSMSSALLREIYQLTSQLRSVHLMESDSERQLFEEYAGPFRTFYQKLNLPYKPVGIKSPWKYITADLAVDEKIIWVHCTDMRPDELTQLAMAFPGSMFCLCPRSNDYIHKKIPNIHHFLPFADRICLGTDSLASNHSLDLFEEIQLLQQVYPDVTLHTLVKWATTQGAKALQQSDKFGIFAPNLRPGINLIKDIDLQQMRLTAKSQVEKLF